MTAFPRPDMPGAALPEGVPVVDAGALVDGAGVVVAGATVPVGAGVVVAGAVVSGAVVMSTRRGVLRVSPRGACTLRAALTDQ